MAAINTTRVLATTEKFFRLVIPKRNAVDRRTTDSFHIL
jgi:hypothetical protein